MKEQGLTNSNFLVWTGLRQSVPSKLRVNIQNLLNKKGHLKFGCLSIRDIMIGILKEGMDLINYIVIIGKTYLWTCRCKGIIPIFNHFKNISEIKYETKKYITFKTNKICH